MVKIDDVTLEKKKANEALDASSSQFGLREIGFRNESMQSRED